MHDFRVGIYDVVFLLFLFNSMQYFLSQTSGYKNNFFMIENNAFCEFELNLFLLKH